MREWDKFFSQGTSSARGTSWPAKGQVGPVFGGQVRLDIPFRVNKSVIELQRTNDKNLFGCSADHSHKYPK